MIIANQCRRLIVMLKLIISWVLTSERDRLCVCVCVGGCRSDQQLVGGWLHWVECFGLRVLVFGARAGKCWRAVREICILTPGFIVILRSISNVYGLAAGSSFSVLVELDSFMKIYSPSCIFSARSLILCCIIVQWYMKKSTLAEAKKNVFLMQDILLWSQHFVQAAFPF